MIPKLTNCFALLLCIEGFFGSAIAQDPPVNDAADHSLAGQWVTNQGVLDLSIDGDSVSGTLDQKTKVSGSLIDNQLVLKYRRSLTTTVSLELHESGRWLSGESKARNSTRQWFGSRQNLQDDEASQTADFSQHWLLSWGIMQLTQDKNKVDGQYGADGYGKINGTVVGQRLNLTWRRHRSSGKAWVEQSPDGKQLIGQTVDVDKPSVVVGIRADGYEPSPQPQAAKMVHGIADNGMLYHLRMPDDWKAGQATDVVVLLHGSNFTTAGMVGVVARQWPEIAKRFAILGIQGERWAKWSTAKDLRFNYSYVNWMGRSTYRGFPFTDRESPTLVMNVIDELDDQHSFDRVFVGGHSQGGYLTYLLHMHFPEKIAGSFPVAGGLVIQTEPRVFDDEALMEAQRNTPMVIVHGTQDRIVNASTSDYAYQQFLSYGFPRVKRLSPDARHAFDFLPIGDAIQWLDQVTSSDAGLLRDSAAQCVADKNWRDAGALIDRAKVMGVADQLQSSVTAFEAAAEQTATKYLDAIEKNSDGSWIEDYLDWQDQFSLSTAAEPVLKAFDELKAVHSQEAKRLETEARKAFNARKTDEGWSKYREIVDQYYASPQYRTLKNRVAKHFDSQ